MAREAAARGLKVLAVDADPDANLAATLGIQAAIVPLADQEELIAERAGREGFVRLNPTVDDIPERYWVEAEGVRLLVLGGISRGGGGCACPANALLRALLAHLVLRRDELVLVDMEAGIEHLGRATARGGGRAAGGGGAGQTQPGYRLKDPATGRGSGAREGAGGGEQGAGPGRRGAHPGRAT
ncbi:hypothetical protein LR090_01890 [Candidatus Bipolaricaulota bacterium]|nr:hypothetical protein [Candidatus Bipolaricaulota bacterium]